MLDRWTDGLYWLLSFQDVAIWTMFRWCQLSVEKAGWPSGCGPAAVLWDTRVTSVTAAQLVSRGQSQQRGRSAPASPAAAGGAAVTLTLVTVTQQMRPQERRPVLEASIGTAGTLIPASNVPVQMECPAQLRMDLCSPSVTSVHSEVQVEHVESAPHTQSMTASVPALRSPL